MEEYRGARVSSDLSERKRRLLDQGIELGHKPGCIHVYADRVFELNERTGQVTDFGFRCGCTETQCHNCGEEVSKLTREVPQGRVNYDPVVGPSVPTDYDPLLAAKYEALLARMDKIENETEEKWLGRVEALQDDGE